MNALLLLTGFLLTLIIYDHYKDRKPKFSVGQVVCIERGLERVYLKIIKIENNKYKYVFWFDKLPDGTPIYAFYGGHETEIWSGNNIFRKLRPLEEQYFENKSSNIIKTTLTKT